MLTESFIAATLATSTKSNTPSTLKDVGIVLHEFQPQSTLRHGFKKSSTKVNCVAISSTHIFAAQADKAVVHVYNREKGNQESTVAFPERIHSLAFMGESSGYLILGTEGGRLTLWDVASGRQTFSTASHLQPVSCLSVLPGNQFILSGSSDSNVHVWPLPQLVSFSQSQSISSNDPPPNSPLRTFSNHRSGITALACGHSRPLSNFAVSASAEATCYVWSTSDCQILRTILLPSVSQSLAVDPMDRALYSSHEDGSIQFFNFYNDSQKTQNIRSPELSYPRQLLAEESWSPASTNIGSAQCLTLSYGGTTLLSGHASGKILSWDVAKHRVHKVIADIGQPVTNIAMELPEGLPNKRPRIKVKTVVKPKIDSSPSHQPDAISIPVDYSLQVQISPSQSSHLLTPSHETDFHALLTNPIFPKHLIDEAVLDLTFAQISPSKQTTTSYEIPYSPGSASVSRIFELESRIADLEKKIASFHSACEKSRARRLERMERREHYGQRKREAFFVAEKKGEDGDEDVEMKEWKRKESEVDEESDEVELGQEVYADV